MSVRALVCDAWCHYSQLSLREVEPPAMRAGCVRVRVCYAAVSHGQRVVMEGRYQRKPPRPFSPGSEIAGIVLEVAPDVRHLRPGDRVAAAIDWGGYAQEAVVTQETAWRIPDGVAMELAATLPITWATAWCALHWRGRISSGQTVAVFGAAGGVGLAAVALARRAGARVLAVAGSPERLSVARMHGAHEGILRNAPDLVERLKAWSGGGLDVLFDPVGGALTLDGLRCMAPEGRMLLVGFASEDIPALPANLLLVKNVEAVGVFFGHYIGWGKTDERKRFAPRLAAMMEELFGAVLAGQIRPESPAIYPLDRFAEAFDSLVQRRSRGRVLLRLVS